MGADKHKKILMPLILLVAEATIRHFLQLGHFSRAIIIKKQKNSEGG